MTVEREKGRISKGSSESREENYISTSEQYRAFVFFCFQVSLVVKMYVTENLPSMWYISSMDYSSAIKKNEIRPSAATWMDLEIIILSEVWQGNTNITCMWNLKYDTNEHICETETDSQT